MWPRAPEQAGASEGSETLDTAALTAFGLFLAGLGVTLIYFFAIRRRTDTENFVSEEVHIVRDELGETVDMHTETVMVAELAAPESPAALRDAIGFLGWLALIGPAVMYWVLRYATGVPHLEAHMARTRGAAFEDYKRRTNLFFPGPRKA